MYQLRYHPDVVRRDIPKIATSWKTKIKQSIEAKLTTEPDLYGKPLRRSLKGYRKLRVGDYRVVFRIQEQSVLILMIAHRSIVYDQVSKRL